MCMWGHLSGWPALNLVFGITVSAYGMWCPPKISHRWLFWSAYGRPIKSPAHLRRARECWWQSQLTMCLVNQAWDDQANEVVAPRLGRSDARVIQTAVFDAQRHRTILQLEGVDVPVETEL